MTKISDEEERIQRVYRNYVSTNKTATWSAANPGNLTAYQRRRSALRSMLQNMGFWPLANRRILDVGCGLGDVLAGFTQWGAEPSNLVGVDLLEDRIETAKIRYPTVRFERSNAEQLAFEDRSFDLVLYFTVFSSILDDTMARNVASEGARLLKSNGAVIWYDFRYPSPNRNTRPMQRVDIQKLFPDFSLLLRTITLLPPLARRLSRLTPVLYPLLAAIPPLRSHYLGLLVKPS